jgi:hypothetical protein
MKFQVEVNPFKQVAVINTKIGAIYYTQVMYFEQFDEWNSFKFGGQIFDIHFLYDMEFMVSIYPVIDNKADYTKLFEVELTIKLTDYK